MKGKGYAGPSGIAVGMFLNKGNATSSNWQRIFEFDVRINEYFRDIELVKVGTNSEIAVRCTWQMMGGMCLTYLVFYSEGNEVELEPCFPAIDKLSNENLSRQLPQPTFFSNAFIKSTNNGHYQTVNKEEVVHLEQLFNFSEEEKSPLSFPFYTFLLFTIAIFSFVFRKTIFLKTMSLLTVRKHRA